LDNNKAKKTETLLDVTTNDAQNNEFVSDSYETSINEEEMKREMKQLNIAVNKNTAAEGLFY
jgi:hypothetical protein